jgi:electron transfer flavoprotein beta subunit
VPGRLKAKKVPIEEREPVSAPSGAARLRMVLPPPTPSAVEILGEGPEAAGAVVDLLERLGVLTPGKAAP